jgi:hypothetical protein
MMANKPRRIIGFKNTTCQTVRPYSLNGLHDDKASR